MISDDSDEKPNFQLGSEVMCDLLQPDAKKKQIRTFKQNELNDQIDKINKKVFAPQSRRKMKWVLNMYDQWRGYRLKQQSCPEEVHRCDLNLVGLFTQSDLCFVLAHFICEVKRIDNSDYPPNTLREIIIMIQIHLNENNVFWKLLESDQFRSLRNVVDNMMKERTALGLGQHVSSEIITLNHEEKMFASKALGTENPEQLFHSHLHDEDTLSFVWRHRT